jgi:hypothetical protein
VGQSHFFSLPWRGSGFGILPREIGLAIAAHVQCLLSGQVPVPGFEPQAIGFAVMHSSKHVPSMLTELHSRAASLAAHCTAVHKQLSAVHCDIVIV